MFFRKTYQTDGLKELLETVQKRLEGRGGDSVLQVQTPFGGGKTHSMIALYHKAGEWNAKRVVLVGTVLTRIRLPLGRDRAPVDGRGQVSYRQDFSGERL
ncbi:hypothetical protein [Mesotoga sp.]|uniref:hypothetical protein n=1 Tax=Mesotoga sp. TaxID=2053577 RepID=UPI00345ECFB1